MYDVNGLLLLSFVSMIVYIYFLGKKVLLYIFEKNDIALYKKENDIDIPLYKTF